MSHQEFRKQRSRDRGGERGPARTEVEGGGQYSASFKARTLRSRRFEARARSASRAEVRFNRFDDERE